MVRETSSTLSFQVTGCIYRGNFYNFADFKLGRALNSNSCVAVDIFKRACLYSNDIFLHELFERIPDADVVFENSDTLLHLVCKSEAKPVEKAKIIMAQNSTLVRKQNANGLLALHFAVLHENPDYVR